MGFKVVEAGRMIQKIITTSGTTFAVAPSSDHTDGSWAANHLYDGEFGINSNPASIKLQVRISGTVYNIPFSTISGSGIAAAGNNTEVQFNDSGALGASSGFTFVKATGQLTLLKDSNYILFDPANEQYGAYIQNASGGGAQVFLNGDNGSDVTATLTALNSAGTRGGSLQVNATSGTASVIAGLSSDVQYKVDGVNQKAYFIVTAVNYHEWGKGYYAVHPASVSGTGEIRFLELAASGSHYAGFKAPDALAANIIYVLPSTDPTVGQVLTAAAPSGGVCVLTWAAGGGGGSQTPWTSDINADGFVLYGNDGSGETLTISSTSHATKGFTYIGASTKFAFDEVNSRMGVAQATPTSRFHLNFNVNGVTQADANGILLANSSAATVGLQSISPPLVIQGNGWATGVNNSQDVRFRIQVLPIQAATNPTGELQIARSINGGAYTNIFSLSTGSELYITYLNSARVNGTSQVYGGFSSTSAQTYRLTNGGSNVTPAAFFGTATTTAGNLAIGQDLTNSLTFLAANGTRFIARAGIAVINLDNTAGSEDADLSLLTQSAGGAMSSKMVITNDGRIYGIGIHNNAGAVTGTVNQYIASGTYTPTLTNVANLTASTAYSCQWMRVGNVVTVSGKVDLDPTLTATLTQLGISLPIASAFANIQDCGGSAFASGIVGQGAAILADAANDRAEMDFISGDITNQPMFFTFQYLVL